MTVHHASRHADLPEIEDAVQEWASEDHGTHFSVIEVLDHPSAAYSEKHGTVTGPLVFGPTDEVLAWLTEQGYEDTETHAEALIIDPDEEGDDWDFGTLEDQIADQDRIWAETKSRWVQAPRIVNDEDQAWDEQSAEEDGLSAPTAADIAENLHDYDTVTVLRADLVYGLSALADYTAAAGEAEVARLWEAVEPAAPDDEPATTCKADCQGQIHVPGCTEHFDWYAALIVARDALSSIVRSNAPDDVIEVTGTPWAAVERILRAIQDGEL